MEIVEGVEKSIDSFAGEGPAIDARHVTEIVALLEVLETWRNHPGWPELVRGLGNEYSHTVAMLAAAKILKDQGHSVTLQEGRVGRAADLLLVVGVQQYTTVEVKAPKDLRWRNEGLTQGQANGIVEAAAKSAGVGKTGQLSPANPGILVIGGFHLSSGDLGRLEEAGNSHFAQARSTGRHAHIMAIVHLSLGSSITAYNGLDRRRDLKAHVDVRVSTNPTYRGDIEFDDSPWTE
jgi:hypothetical protein